MYYLIFLLMLITPFLMALTERLAARRRRNLEKRITELIDKTGTMTTLCKMRVLRQLENRSTTSMKFLAERLEREARASTGSSVPSAPPRIAKIHTLPGIRLRRLAEVVFSQKVMRDVIEPLLADLQYEYTEAVAQHRGRAKFFFIRMRGYWSFFSAAGLQTVVSLGKRIVEIYKSA